MLWLLVIMLIGGLSFVIFHKPHVHAMGAGWIPPEQRKLEQPKAASPGTKMLTDGSNHDVQTSVEEAVTAREEAVTARVVKPMPDTFDFNDLFGGKQPPADRQNV